MAEAVAAELTKVVTVQENGRRNRYSKRDVAAKQLVNKAVAGDLRALKLVREYMETPEWKEMTEQLYPSLQAESPGDRIMRRLREMRERQEAADRGNQEDDLPGS